MRSFLLLASLAAIVPISAQPASVPEPPDIGLFWVDPVTRAPRALESVESKRENAYRSYSCYLPGAQSPVQIPYGDQTFVTYRFATVEDTQKDAMKSLERLTVQKGRRYGTGVFVPMTASPQGARVFGLFHDKRKDPGRQTFVLHVRALPIGEYAFPVGSGVTNALGCGLPTPAFSVVPAPVTTTAPAFTPGPATPVATPPASPTSAAGVALDLDQLRQAAGRGDAAAHFQLGEAYARGRGVLQDFVEAHKWLNLAAARLTGPAQAQAAALRDDISARMTPAQIADAQRLAREWLEAFRK